ncbi:oxidoreductase NAD-binding domain protein [Pyrenochaeta sp. DS3sAY3a]|nr:oxidoreductase NAD-binding domain protein [Pyrenochaeta sp. DS3sAY3a]
MPESWDAIIIGSGIGGLAAASLLAKVSGKRVLVLEKHSERGGLTHTFRRDGASWDVGLHYVGDVGEGSSLRYLFDFMSGGELKWNKMCGEFERFVYPGVNFTVPSDRKQYQARLVERYPDEATAIRHYFRDLEDVSTWFSFGVAQETMPWPLSSFMSAWRSWNKKKALQTTEAYLNSHFKSPELKAVLASQWPDYGLPPSESAFTVHALVAQSFMKGGWFPQGGSSRIARTFETAIEARGGAVKVSTEVTKILTNGEGRVIGVTAKDLSILEPTELTYHSSVVISNAGAELTYNRLLPIDGDIGKRTANIRSFINKINGGPSAVTLYLRLTKPVSTIGINGENFWINTTLDHGDLKTQTAALLEGKPQHVYMSFPSTKAGDNRFHTAEILAMVNGDAFSAWRATEHGMRGKTYLELKDRISKGLLDLAKTAAPGLKALVQYSELSTPLSVEDYTSRASGSIYGLKATPERYQSSALSAAPPVPGLYLSGSDACSLGIAGALMGGVMAASRVLGPLGFLQIMKAARSPPAKPTPQLHAGYKKRATVVSKTALTPRIWHVEFEVEDEVADYAPGQFAFLKVAPFEWRSYSIAGVDGRRVKLLVSTSTGGDGSVFIESCKVGDETQVELPFGTFRLQNSEHRKIFVATGTGLAPFLPMFAALKAQGELEAAELLFGCRRATEGITAALSPLPKTTLCVSGDAAVEGVFHGRVTKALEGLAFDPKTTDFYLCGAPEIINDCRAILVGKGAERVYLEPY